jgi:VIT1/CCC1 family predicted Fe2+/Mn2+ transporter
VKGGKIIMQEIEKKWIVIMMLFIGAGYAIGALIKFILKKLIISEVFTALINLIIPLFMVIAIFVFLYVYHKYQQQ